MGRFCPICTKDKEFCFWGSQRCDENHGGQGCVVGRFYQKTIIFFRYFKKKMYFCKKIVDEFDRSCYWGHCWLDKHFFCWQGRIIACVIALSFIMMDCVQGIGFLSAAKSVFRFGDLRSGQETKMTEGVLLGWLISMAVVTIVGILTRFFDNRNSWLLMVFVAKTSWFRLEQEESVVRIEKNKFKYNLTKWKKQY